MVYFLEGRLPGRGGVTKKIKLSSDVYRAITGPGSKKIQTYHKKDTLRCLCRKVIYNSEVVISMLEKKWNWK